MVDGVVKWKRFKVFDGALDLTLSNMIRSYLPFYHVLRALWQRLRGHSNYSVMMFRRGS